MLKYFLFSLNVIFFLFLGCSEDKQKPENQTTKSESSKKIDDQENLAESKKNLSESFNEGKKVNPVDFHKLKSLFPEKIGSIKRTNASGEKSGEKSSAMGINVSRAEANYREEQ